MKLTEEQTATIIELKKRYDLLKEFENSKDFQTMNDLVVHHYSLENDYKYARDVLLESILGEDKKEDRDNKKESETSSVKITDDLNYQKQFLNKHFKPQEFRGWYDKIHPELLIRINYVREVWGEKISISSVNGAIGRHQGASSESRHNIDHFGKVMALDIFPDKIGYDKKKALEFYILCKKAGFKGIGVYPHHKPSIGFHLDLRDIFVDWVDIATYPEHDYKYNYAVKYLSN